MKEAYYILYGAEIPFFMQFPEFDEEAIECAGFCCPVYAIPAATYEKLANLMEENHETI